ncbi:MAG: hypothetical protein HC838_13545 [Spirulinaceae cyanobacterium RM2_2_10]|nr:hypothetical protein [Spirulinaceae cyanobacterium SM2_1_0]NJO20850.1 hypothetical protein [Spirulinaceae cyanobacterium RM2_2_10]
MCTSPRQRLYLTTALLAALGGQAATATPLASGESERLLARDCPDGRLSRFYARVSTESDPLMIRSAPGGRIIGAAPKDWLVVVSERDASGEWARIGNHWSHWESELVGGPTASAPEFTVGWVAADYLTNLGDFCEKPNLVSQVQPLQTATQVQAVLVEEDWLALGDRLATQL